MKAIVCDKFGLPEVLKIEEVPAPKPGRDEVLVKVHGASVTYSTMMLISGQPFIGRLMGLGLTQPKQKIQGADIAGWVVEVGANITRFKPGDEVFGDLSDLGRGGFAEYVAGPESGFAIKPANLTFEEATAGYCSIFDYRKALAPEGIYVSTRGRWARLSRHLCLGRSVLAGQNPVQ